MVVTFSQALDKIRSETDNGGGHIDKLKRGKRFELLIKQFLEKDSVYSDKFIKVETWTEYADNHDISRKDLGIDLVGTDKYGTECAIQCKCYNDDSILGKSDIDTTYAEAAKHPKMNKFMIVFTGASIGQNAELQTKETNTIVLMQDELSKCSIDWTEHHVNFIKEVKNLYDYQEKAVNNIVTSLANNDRGKLIMACGTGKTLVSLKIAEQIAGVGKTVLYLVPSLYLIPQTMREWADNKDVSHEYLAVCSDSTVDQDANGSITEILINPTTNTDELKKELRRENKKLNARHICNL